jgi:hypothetical protein
VGLGAEFVVDEPELGLLAIAEVERNAIGGRRGSSLLEDGLPSCSIASGVLEPAMPLLNGGGSRGTGAEGGAGVDEPDLLVDCARCRPSLEDEEDCLCLSLLDES